ESGGGRSGVDWAAGTGAGPAWTGGCALTWSPLDGLVDRLLPIVAWSGEVEQSGGDPASPRRQWTGVEHENSCARTRLPGAHGRTCRPARVMVRFGRRGLSLDHERDVDAQGPPARTG